MASTSGLAQPLSLEAAPPLDAHSLQAWTMKDGLPQTSVNDMAQTKDGYLWLATFGGLSRFDGTHFEVFDQTNGLVEPRVLALDLGPDGALWIALESGGVAVRRSDAFETVRGAEALTTQTVRDISVSADSVWLATDEGILSISSDGMVTRVTSTAAQGLRSDGQGGVFAVTEFKTLHLTQTSAQDELEGPVRILIESPTRQWRLGPTSLSLWDGDTQRTLAETTTPHWLSVGPIVGPNGALWFSVGANLYRFDVRTELLEDPSAPISQGDIHRLPLPRPIRSLFVDREQSMWVGTDGAGLYRITPQPFIDVLAQHGLNPEPAHAVVRDSQGAYLTILDCAVVRLAPGKEVQTIYSGEDCPRALSTSRSGELWIAGRQVSRYSPDGFKVVLTQGAVETITTLLVTSQDELYVGTRGGLYVVEDDSPVRVGDTDSTVGCLVEGQDGTVWAGLQGRVLELKQGHVRTLTAADGVPSGLVRAIVPRGSKELWLGSYGGGITRLHDGRVQHLNRKSGLVDNFISSLVFDAEDHLWVNANQGVFRVDRAQIDAHARGEVQTVSSHPLPTPEGIGGHPSFAIGPDRHVLAFTTIEGLVEVDSRDLRPNLVPPEVNFTSITIDNLSLAPGRGARIPPGRGRLDASFTAGMLRRPSMASFEYRLRGVDSEWNLAPRSRSAHYDNLGPGAYCLDVRAINEDRVAGPVAVSCFEIEPHLYERTSLRLASALLGLLLLWGGHRWRTRAIEARNAVLRREVMQRKLAEIAVSEREAHYRRVFEASVSGFILTDHRNRVTDVNPALCKMLGIEREALLQRPLHEVLGWPEQGPRPDDLPQTHDEGPLGQVVLCRRGDGSPFEARVASKPFPNSNHSVRLTIINDISALLQAQAQEHRLKEELLHSQRIEAIGVLAGGVAHDVNNMLTAVQGYAELAKDSLERTGDVGDATSLIDEVLSSAKRTSNVTRQLLAYGRRHETQTRRLDLSALVKEIETLLVRGLSPHVQLQFVLAEGLPCVEADRTQIEQVVMNLVINAIAAMPNGGTITITTLGLGLKELSAQYPETRFEAPQVCLRVEDEGTGMSEQVKARIFDPFFTTKAVGEGTGLGLSGAFGIVSKAGGHILVRSEPGRGSRFDVLLPALAGTAPPTSTQDLTQEPGLAQQELLAYVDDDPAVRTATSRLLKRAGYRLLVYGDPMEALEALEGAPEIPRLLVTDMVMPGMNGAELARRLMDKYPQLAVLYISGYSGESLSSMDPQRERFLSKPFGYRGLIGAVQELLGQAPGKS